MPRRAIRIRGIEQAFERIFGNRAKAPIGRLSLTRAGSGYFGSLYGGSPKDGHGLVFNLNVLPEHSAHIERARTHYWAGPKAVCHTALWVLPKKIAIVTVIQPTANLKNAGLSSRVRGQYRYAEIATAIAAIEYCRRNGIRLCAVHPQNYKPLHMQAGEMSGDIPHYYQQTLENAAKGLGLKWKETILHTEHPMSGHARFFGNKLLELVE